MMISLRACTSWCCVEDFDTYGGGRFRRLTRARSGIDGAACDPIDIDHSSEVQTPLTAGVRDPNPDPNPGVASAVAPCLLHRRMEANENGRPQHEARP